VSTGDPGDRGPIVFPALVGILVLVLGAGAAYLYGRLRAGQGLRTALEDLARRGQLVSDIQVHLLATTDAQKAAVMADTDRTSQDFADEARKEAAVVETKRGELGKLILAANRPGEVKPFGELSACWKRYQQVDDLVLDLAVQNTNQKAQRLSFAPATDALDRMQAALEKLETAAGSSARGAATTGAACRAVTAALQIHVLESRHIAEPRDEVMDQIEARMKELDAQVEGGFADLAKITGAAGLPDLEAARTAYADFQELNAQILKLSRQNSNVRSLAISLGQARNTAAECQADLGALQQAIASQKFEATR
jgi:hypothetical protein